MPKKEEILRNIAISKRLELDVITNGLYALYEKSYHENSDLFDIASKLTCEYRHITSKSIEADSRIIKILRYSIVPSISQMKFGQMFGLKSTKKLEAERVIGGTSTHRELCAVSNEMAVFISRNLDQRRFVWAKGGKSPASYDWNWAKAWTCSLASDQNAQTAHRNARKSEQEELIANKLKALGYVRSRHTKEIANQQDIRPGEFTCEIKVRGRTTQKADVVLRTISTNRLVLIEAKSVGVELDATKRVKECCDKARDWTLNKDLGKPLVIAVISGFFSVKNIQNLRSAKVEVVWQHNLDALENLT